MMVLAILLACLISCGAGEGATAIPKELVSDVAATNGKIDFKIDESSDKLSLYVDDQPLSSLGQLKEQVPPNVWSKATVLRLNNTGIVEIKEGELPPALTWIIIREKSHHVPKTIVFGSNPLLDYISLDGLSIAKLVIRDSVDSTGVLLQTNECVFERFPEIHCTLSDDELDLGNSVVLNCDDAKGDQIRFLRIKPHTLDLTWVRNLPNLEWLVVGKMYSDIRFRYPFSLAGVEGLKKLSYLGLFGLSGLLDFRPIADCVNLTNLVIRDTKLIIQMMDFSKLGKLRAVQFKNCGITDTSFMGTIKTRLSILLLEGNPIRRIAGLEEIMIGWKDLAEYNALLGTGPYEPSMEIDIEKLERITRRDFEFLKKSAFPKYPAIKEMVDKGTVIIED